MDKNKSQKNKPMNGKNMRKITVNKTNTSENTVYESGENNRMLRGKNLESLLERKKLHLVLDLDNTLIHCTTLSNRCKLALKDKGDNKFKKAVDGGELHEILGGGFMVKLRPGARDFIKEAKKLFDLSIYTKSGKAYAVEVAKLLADNEDASCFFTEITSSKHNDPKETKKELRKVMVHERVVMVVDDRVDVWSHCDSENIINVKPYCFFPEEVKGWPKMMKDTEKENHDGELVRALSMLKVVHTKFYSGDYASKDVRQVLKSIQANSA